MHAAAISPRGGVSPRGTLLRGQSIIEYVLIIAIIGLVIVFAGPGVAGAIRNQFNLVGNTVNNGTTAGAEGGGATGGGSAGADSATVQAAIAKDAKDWTLDEQQAVAEDIAAKGEASSAWAKAKAAMDAGTTWSIKLTNGETMTYRIIGINHDDLANGSGKAGLTFLTTSKNVKSHMNATSTTEGGWEKSEIRSKMNSGEIWSLMPHELQSKMKSVYKMTNNSGGPTYYESVTATSDKMFLLSLVEMVDVLPENWASGRGWLHKEGTQYEAFKGKVPTAKSDNPAIAIGANWLERTVYPNDVGNREIFLYVSAKGNPGYWDYANPACYVCPAWCF